MKYHLVFSGMQQRDNENEKTETVLKVCLTHELGITNANEIGFQNVNEQTENHGVLLHVSPTKLRHLEENLLVSIWVNLIGQKYAVFRGV